VPFAGVLALVGGLSVALGYRTRIGAAMLIAFLIPVTFMMHRFWAMPDPQSAQIQLAMYMKNLSMLGGALMLLYFGGGPVSVDARETD
jgi:putative oxidoreductase